MDKELKLKQIENAIGINLYDWQRDYVLNDNIDNIPSGRRSGKTITYIVYILVNREEPLTMYKDGSGYNKYHDLVTPMLIDNDYSKNSRWHNRELYHYWKICKNKGVDVFDWIIEENKL